VPIPNPHVEPRVSPIRPLSRASSHLTLVRWQEDCLSTTVWCFFPAIINPPGAPDVGFFHDDTCFSASSSFESAAICRRLSSSTEKTFSFTDRAERQYNSSAIRLIFREHGPHPSERQLLFIRNVFFESVHFEISTSSGRVRDRTKFDSDFVDRLPGARFALGDAWAALQASPSEEFRTFVYHGLDARWVRTEVSNEVLSPHQSRMSVWWRGGRSNSPSRRTEIEIAGGAGINISWLGPNLLPTRRKTSQVICRESPFAAACLRALESGSPN